MITSHVLIIFSNIISLISLPAKFPKQNKAKQPCNVSQYVSCKKVNINEKAYRKRLGKCGSEWGLVGGTPCFSLFVNSPTCTEGTHVRQS